MAWHCETGELTVSRYMLGRRGVITHVGVFLVGCLARRHPLERSALVGRAVADLEPVSA